MRSTFIAILLLPFLSSAASMADSSWAAQRIRLGDSRLTLNSCSSDSGLLGFRKQYSPDLMYYCSADVKNQSKRNVLIVKRGSDVQYYEVSACGQQYGFGEQEYGHYTQKCTVQKLNYQTLQPYGYKGVINYTVSWEYSEGLTRFKFKMDNRTVSGMLVPVEEIRRDY